MDEIDKKLFKSETNGMVKVYNELVKIQNKYTHTMGGFGKDINIYINNLNQIIKERKNFLDEKNN